MGVQYAPGLIKFSKETWYKRYPDLDDRILAHIEAWRDSVEPGTMVTLNKMMNCSSTCGCPADGQLLTCQGSGHGMPIEIVTDIVFPFDGSPCPIAGVEGVSAQGPLLEVSFGMPKFIKRTA